MPSLEESLLRDIKHQKDLVRDSSGDLETIVGEANLKEHLFRRLITVPGTVIHRPEYGVGIKRFQNAPMTLDTQRNIAKRIEEQFLRDARVAEVTGVRFETEDLPTGQFRLIVRVRVVGSGEEEMDFVPFSAGE